MSQVQFYPDWQQQVQFTPSGPQPEVLLQDAKVKIVMAGLEPGQRIPEHPEGTSMYHFLAGEGWMVVDGQRLPVGPGTTIVMEAGAIRGMEATTRLAFLATRVA